MTSLPPPPDRAPLASLEVRRAYLSDPTVAYRLPREGILVLADGWEAKIQAAKLTVWTGDDSRTVPLAEAETASLTAAWTELWSAPASTDEAETLLHFRGAFRVVVPPNDAPIHAWINAVLAAR